MKVVRNSTRATIVPSQLIFIIGFPRSGTSWFANLINAHPDTLYRHEILGRHYRLFGPTLFHRIKFDHGLSNEDYARARQILLRPEVGADKPPFFRKRFDRTSGGTLRSLSWFAARAIPILRPVYSRMFTPRTDEGISIVIKETRSSIDLESILSGLRISTFLVVIRHPYNVIASHLRGFTAGVMMPTSAQMRQQSWQYHAQMPYVHQSGLTERQFLSMSEIEFLAVMWRIQNEEFLRIQSGHPKSRVFLYEDCVNDTRLIIDELFALLGLPLESEVSKFARESTRPRTKRAWLRTPARFDYFRVSRRRELEKDDWRKTFTANDIKLIDLHTYPLVARLGLGRWISDSSDGAFARSGVSGH